MTLYLRLHVTSVNSASFRRQETILQQWRTYQFWCIKCLYTYQTHIQWTACSANPLRSYCCFYHPNTESAFRYWSGYLDFAPGNSLAALLLPPHSMQRRTGTSQEPLTTCLLLLKVACAPILLSTSSSPHSLPLCRKHDVTLQIKLPLATRLYYRIYRSFKNARATSAPLKIQLRL